MSESDTALLERESLVKVQKVVSELRESSKVIVFVGKQFFIPQFCSLRAGKLVRR